jgi:hypothetical protein
MEAGTMRGDRMKIIDIEGQLNKTRFSYCSDVFIGDVVHFSMTDKVSVKEMVCSLIRIIRNEICRVYSFRIIGKGITGMLFSSSYRKREDMKRYFLKLANAMDNVLIILCDGYHLCFPKRTLLKCFVWYKELKDINISMGKKVYIVSLIQQFYCNWIEIDRYLDKNRIDLKNLVSLCDVMPADSFIIQKANENGINTITLQHGTTTVGQYLFTHLKCNWFLAINEFQKEVAIKSGVDASKIVVVGSIKGFAKNNSIRISHNYIIGVFLGGPNLLDEDTALMEMVKKYSNKYNYKIIAKCHPGWGANKYPNRFFDWIEKVYEDEIDPIEFGKMADFTVDNGSTLFIECCAMMIPDFTYIHKRSSYYGNPNIEMTFSSYETMESLFNTYNETPHEIMDMMKGNRNYLIPSKEISELLDDFLVSNT